MSRPLHLADLIVFDFDGVLLDSEVLSQRVERERLAMLGMEIDLETFRTRFTGVPTRDILVTGAAELGVEISETFIQAARSDLRALMEGVQRVAGAHELISGLPHRIALASNSPRDAMDRKLASSDLARFFAGANYSREDVARPKPAPDLYRLAVERAGVSPANAIAVEDSATGVTAAHAAGLTVVGFLGGSHQSPAGAAALTSAGASVIVHDMTALGALLNPTV